MTSLSLFTFMHWRRKWQPTPVFLPGESQGREAWLAAVYGVAQSWTRLKRLSSSSSIIGGEGWPRAWHSGKQRTGGPQEELPGITGAAQVSRRQVCANTENGNKDNDICNAHGLALSVQCDTQEISMIITPILQGRKWTQRSGKISKFTYMPGG